MIRKLLLFIIPLIGLLGGGAAGAILRPASGDGDMAGKDEQADSHGETAPAKVDKQGLAWFRFPSQFFVPIIRNARPEAVMVLTLTIETTKGFEKSVYDKEHKFRDALLRQLLIHANTGGFDGNFTSDAHMSELRSKLLAAVRAADGEEVRDVLIEDIMRQPQ